MTSPCRAWTLWNAEQFMIRPVTTWMPPGLSSCCCCPQTCSASLVDYYVPGSNLGSAFRSRFSVQVSVQRSGLGSAFRSRFTNLLFDRTRGRAPPALGPAGPRGRWAPPVAGAPRPHREHPMSMPSPGHEKASICPCH
jgi:hypothetical protein